MAGNIDAGDLVLVSLGKCQNVLLGLRLKHGQSGVDEDSVGGGNQINHGLKLLDVSKGLTTGENKVAVGSDRVHAADALTDLLQRETGQICILAFVDAERTVVVAIVGNENGYGCAALTSLIRIFHHDVDRPFVIEIYRKKTHECCLIYTCQNILMYFSEQVNRKR
jgi:hypothetical protein